MRPACEASRRPACCCNRRNARWPHSRDGLCYLEQLGDLSSHPLGTGRQPRHPRRHPAGPGRHPGAWPGRRVTSSRHPAGASGRPATPGRHPGTPSGRRDPPGRHPDALPGRRGSPSGIHGNLRKPTARGIYDFQSQLLKLARSRCQPMRRSLSSAVVASRAARNADERCE